jgi:hypothetical protein
MLPLPQLWAGIGILLHRTGVEGALGELKHVREGCENSSIGSNHPFQFQC